MLAPPPDTELTLDIRSMSAAEIAAALSALCRPARAKVTRFRSIYFDTAGLDLAREGLMLSVEEAGQRRRQRLTFRRKSEQAPDWQSESAVQGPAPEPARLPALPHRLAALLRNQPPRAIFMLAGVTRQWTLPDAAGELVLRWEDCRVTSGDGIRQLQRLVLPHAFAQRTAVLRLIRQAGRPLALRLSLGTPVMTGLRLLRPHARAADRPGRATLDPSAAPGMAFRLIARACLRQFLRHAARFEAAPDPDAIHQMRVAIRRFRCLARLHRENIDPDHYRRLVRLLRFVFARLGAARDWDILSGQIAGQPSTCALMEIAKEIPAAREIAYRRVSILLASPRLIALQAILLGWIEDNGGLSGAGEPLPAHAARLLRRQRRRLRRLGPLDRLDAEALHAVRIEAKRLRYACAFYETLFPAREKRARRLSRRLARLQDVLGTLNDHFSSEAMLQGLGCGLVPAEQAERLRAVKRLRKTAATMMTAVLEAKPFWT